MNASSTRTPRKRSKSREISENTKLYFCIFRQGRKSKSNDAHHLLLTWSATKGGVPMRIELKSLWRSHLPIGPSLSGKYKKKNSWTFPSEIIGIHGANFLKTPAGTSGRYNYHTTTMQKDRWRSISDVKSSKKNHRPRPRNKKKSYRRDYRDLTYRSCYIFFVIIFRFTDIFLTGFLLPLQQGFPLVNHLALKKPATRMTAAYRSKSMRRQHMPFSTWRTSRTTKSSCTEVRFFSLVMVYFCYM